MKYDGIDRIIWLRCRNFYGLSEQYLRQNEILQYLIIKIIEEYDETYYDKCPLQYEVYYFVNQPFILEISSIICDFNIQLNLTNFTFLKQDKHD